MLQNVRITSTKFVEIIHPFISTSAELQIYGVPMPMTQDFIKWHTTFQGNASVGRILFGCE